MWCCCHGCFAKLNRYLTFNVVHTFWKIEAMYLESAHLLCLLVSDKTSTNWRSPAVLPANFAILIATPLNYWSLIYPRG